MLPREAIGCCTPRPKKLKEDSISIASAIFMLAATITVEIALGIICVFTIFILLLPKALEHRI